MASSFDRESNLVIALVELRGPSSSRTILLAVDTGASFTVIRPNTLLAVGYDLQRTLGSQRIATASGPATVPILQVRSLMALGHTRESMNILIHAVPPVFGIHGLLGLDFFRDRRLTIDFRVGEITLE